MSARRPPLLAPLAMLLLLASARLVHASVGKPDVLPWIEDDFPRAVALAQQRQVPIFVENWAPW
ncbi:MAG TPA: hypothetical protein VMH61_06785 [Candidatus Acidoferrales bacterium]|nr:hypothetical protein [Candidatus Acidoferrales bacterium]